MNGTGIPPLRATDLPGGTVTFLFTDIEGSTQLLYQLKERFVDLLAEHHRLLRAAFAKIDTQPGDESPG